MFNQPLLNGIIAGSVGAFIARGFTAVVLLIPMRNNFLRAAYKCSDLIFKRPFIFPNTITGKPGFSGVAY